MIRIMRLSEAQSRALSKLSHKWEPAYRLKEHISTLRSLVRKGLAESKGEGSLGSGYCASTTIDFRLSAKATEALRKARCDREWDKAEREYLQQP